MAQAILWGKFANDSSSPDPAWEQAVGKQESLMHLSRPWAYGREAGGSINYSPFPQQMLDGALNRGSLVFMDWGSWDLNNQADPAFDLQTIVGGNHDAFLHAWAQAATSWGRPVLLRFDWEMNGDWFAWGAQPTQFVAAWRHVVDVFRAEGAKNVGWFWCANQTAPSGTTYSTAEDKLASYYPGDDHVDWTGFDTYNWFQSNTYMTFEQILSGYPNWLGDTYGAVAKIAPSKPMCIGEFNSWNDPRKPAWFTDALARLPTQYPKVRAISVFMPSFSEPAWIFDQATTDAFKAGIAAPVYLAGGSISLLPAGSTLMPYTTDGKPEAPVAPPVDPSVDYAWQTKKAAVLTLAGEIGGLSDQLTAETNRSAGPRRTVIRQLATSIKGRAQQIAG